MLSKRDPIAAQLQLMRLRGDHAKLESKRLFHQSPMRRMLADVRHRLDESLNYRLGILRSVNVFGSFTDDLLLKVADSMEIVTYVQGEDIIVQNDVGDAFYVIEMGRVKVMRKNNAYEVAHEIRQMTKGSFFGELSLLNEEPRSATVTVVSETARALKLSKTMFDELVKSAKNPFAAGKRKEIAGKDITDKVPIFKSLSAALKRKILETMQTVTFPPGSYICKQGAQGNSFYVLTLGSAKITIDGEDFVEREVNRIHPGDFFGEAALLDAANKRTANVIAIDTVTCMTLTKAEFNYLLKGVKGAMNRDHQTRRKSDMIVMYRAQDGERVRRITAMNAANTRHDQRSGRYIKCLFRAVFESLYLNVYARMFRSLLLTEMAVVEYGEIAFRIVTHHRDPAAGVVAIRLAAMDILSKDPNFRSNMENLFVAGLLRQKNALRASICALWNPQQFNDLCNKITAKRVIATKRIYDVGSKATCFYLILRGTVRLFVRSDIEETVVDNDYERMHKALKYERDLVPGDVFGEEVLTGERKRIRAALAISMCDLAIIDTDAYHKCAEPAGGGMSLDERVAIIKQVTIFKNWDQYRLFKAAHGIEQIEFDKGKVIINPGEINGKIYILLSGRVDVYATARSDTPLNALSKFDYFGETGFLNTSIHTKSTSGRYLETYCLLAQSRVQALALSEEHFHNIDNNTALKMLDAYRVRNSWREQRVADVKVEKKAFGDLKRNLNAQVQALAPLVAPIKDAPEVDEGGVGPDGVPRPQTAANTLSKITSVLRASSAVDRASLSTAGSLLGGGWSFAPGSSVAPPTAYHSSGPAVPATPLTPAIGPSRPVTTAAVAGNGTSSDGPPRYVLGHGSVASVGDDGGVTTYGSVGALPAGVTAEDSVVALEGLNSALNRTLTSMVEHYKTQQYAALNAGGLSGPSVLSSASSSLADRGAPPDLSHRGLPATSLSTASSVSHMSTMSTMARVLKSSAPPVPAEALGVPLKSAAKRGVRLKDLEDIPTLINGGYDPFMVICTSKNYRTVAKNQEAVAFLRLPKCARMKDFTRDNGSFFREASRQRSREFAVRQVQSDVLLKAQADVQEGAVREWSDALNEGLGLNRGHVLEDDLYDDDDVGDRGGGGGGGGSVADGGGPDATRTPGTASLQLGDSVSADILDHMSVASTASAAVVHQAATSALAATRHPPPAAAKPAGPSGPSAAASVGDMSVTLGGQLEMSYADSVAHAVYNPDMYVGQTGLEKQLLFGSGKIPTVKSYCKTLTPVERAPFHSNVRLPESVTERDLLDMDHDIATHLDTLRKANTPAGPRLTRLDKLVMGRTSPSRSPSRAAERATAGAAAASQASSAASADGVAPEPSLDAAVPERSSLTAALGLVPVPKPQSAAAAAAAAAAPRRRSLVQLQVEVSTRTPPSRSPLVSTRKQMTDSPSAPPTTTATTDVVMNGLFSP